MGIPFSSLETSTSTAMLKLFAFFIPFVCLVASLPQGPSFDITVTSPNGVTKQIPIREKFPEGIDGAPFTPANECDGYSCTGLQYEYIDKIDGKSVLFGQCQNGFPEYEDDTQVFCFVNADSSCDKKLSNVFPGKYFLLKLAALPMPQKDDLFGISYNTLHKAPGAGFLDFLVKKLYLKDLRLENT